MLMKTIRIFAVKTFLVGEPRAKMFHNFQQVSRGILRFDRLEDDGEHGIVAHEVVYRHIYTIVLYCPGDTLLRLLFGKG